MSDLREKIDEIDDKLMNLLIERMQISKAVGEKKLAQNLRILDSAREDLILQKLNDISGEFADETSDVYKNILKISCNIQRKIIAQKAKFGLIGEKLGHSHSPFIHNQFGISNYQLKELPSDKLEEFLKTTDFRGFNVTIPYKTQIMPFLDKISEDAKAIGSVNTVVKRGDKWIGHNTDIFGMRYMLQNAKICIKDKVVAILGTGGTSKTAQYLAKTEGAKKVVLVEIGQKINYDNIYEQQDIQVIINTTPVGMYPNAGQCLVDIGKFSKLEAVVDVIYNPLMTELVLDARLAGKAYVSGLAMLVEQARVAGDLFVGYASSITKTKQVLNDLEEKLKNIVLIGMPSCGKSTVGRKLSEKMKRTFVDLDSEIVSLAGMPITEIFEKFGEVHFRKLEREQLEKYSKMSGLVISCGGGAVLSDEAYKVAKQNAEIIWIKRDLKKTDFSGRPLLAVAGALEKLWAERAGKYARYADKIVDNDGSVDDAVTGIRGDI